jgi:hypothetical protein
LVEAQYRVSTLKLVDDLEEQALLEHLIERTKPSLPAECRDLHYLLSTPFRYGAPYPIGSRFRRAGMTEGVFYASERVATAVSELAFHRLLFFAESPATPWPNNPVEYSAFSVGFGTARGIDLARPPLDADRDTWRQLGDYGPSQDLADVARSALIEVIRYQSARDPGRGLNLALLACRAFSNRRPTGMQTWRIYLRASGVQALSEFPKMAISLDRDAFAEDPRIAEIVWDR